MSNSHSYIQFLKGVKRLLPADRIKTGYADRFAFGTDASFYRMTPKLVLLVDNADEVSALLKLSSNHQIAVTFRAAGTSLSGQAITSSVLIVVSAQWRNYQIINNGTSIRLQPGIIGADANRILAPMQRKIGPDPASIDACKIGGIAANNASGMCCGVSHNSYHTLRHMQIIFADGEQLDTADQTAREKFLKNKKTLVEGLQKLRAELLQSNTLCERVRRKYRIKNTTGYGINALLDFDDPIEIIQHLMIGSEGTLGFIADIELNTISVNQRKQTALILFSTLQQACQFVEQVKSLSPDAVELLDSFSLRAVKHYLQSQAVALNSHPDCAGLLIEFSESDNWQTIRKQFEDLLNSSLWLKEFSVVLTSEPQLRETLWKIRKGIFPAVGASRPAGSSVIIEDIAVELGQLAPLAMDLRKILRRYGYQRAVIFGHALDGNLHFVFSQDFTSKQSLENYNKLMSAVSQLVVNKYDGSLKAEHGTGRNMAPFVEQEWGEPLFQMMKRIKQLFDPDNRLNPGVIINPDPSCHLKAIKQLPATDPLIDDCIECGFCEAVCPSQHLSWTPRQRIAVWRELNRLRASDPAHPKVAHLEKAFDYSGAATCAATGLCQQRCPVEINTGRLILQYRQQQMSVAQHWFNQLQYRLPSLVNRTARSLLTQYPAATSVALLSSSPQATSEPTTNSVPTATFERTAKLTRVLCFASCNQRVFASHPSQRAFSQVARMAGYDLVTLPQQNQMCCGQALYSRGEFELAKQQLDALSAQLLDWQEKHQLPPVLVLSDEGGCANRLLEHLREQERLKDWQILATTDFLQQWIIPKIKVTPLPITLALHIPCSVKKRSKTTSVIEICQQLCTKLNVLTSFECCGFAGSKGVTLPALNQSSLQFLTEETTDCDLGLSLSASCGSGLEKNCALNFTSLAELILAAASN